MGLFCNHGDLQDEVDSLERRLQKALEQASNAENLLNERTEVATDRLNYAERKISEQRRYIDQYETEMRMYLLEKQELNNRIKLLEGTNKYLADTLDQITKCNEQKRLN